jgi:hypothetical protein
MQPSCSDVALEAFHRQTFSQALPDVLAQFARCRKTYADYTNDVIRSTNAHLDQFAAFTATSAIGCCDCFPAPQLPPGPLG